MIEMSNSGVPAYMNVQPACYGNNCNDGFGFGGNGSWWILLLFILLGNNGGWGGNNSWAPWMFNMVQTNTNNDVQRGFDQQALMTGIGANANAINNLSSQMCNGFNQVEIAAANRQMADMNQNYANQIATMQQMNQLQSQFQQCCCDNRLATANLTSTVLSENCEDRNALNQAMMNLTVANNANTQRLIDTVTSSTQGLYNKICQLELNAKDDKINDLQRQLTASDTKAEINALKGAIINDNTLQTNILENYLRPQANPAYIVQNPNCCPNNGLGYCG